MVKFQGIDIQTGSATNVEVSRIFYEKLLTPNSDCRNNLTMVSTDSKYFKLTSTLSNQYYQRLCYEIYINVNTIIPNCNCSDPSILIPYNNTSICKTKTELNCVNLWKNKFNQQISINDCPLECKSVVYSTNINSASYPTDYYITVLQQNQNVINKFNPPFSFNASLDPTQQSTYQQGNQIQQSSIQPQPENQGF